MPSSDLFYNDQRVACLLRKVVLEIERRISTQSEHLRTVFLVSSEIYIVNCFSIVFKAREHLRKVLFVQQNNVFKAREEKYQSRIKVLETLASGTNEENEVP